jgi:tRNA pseudouridine55 synthase
MTSPRERIARRPVHGVLLLDKLLGPTSNQALQQAKRLYRADKAGHTGTLDPLASGLLPICFGAATKFAQASLDADKTYRATLRLGERTASYDRETPVIERHSVDVDRDRVDEVCRSFVGALEQLPPMYSALKKDGKALYDYARAGQDVARTRRVVHVYRIDVVSFEADQLLLEVACAKGTYIRTLADDIGQVLGCGAHLAALCRTGSGGLKRADALDLATLERMTEVERDARLLPADVLVTDRPEVELDGDEAARFLTGLRRRLASADAPSVRVYAAWPRAFLGLAHITAGELIADRLLSPPEVQACAAAQREPEATL